MALVTINADLSRVAEALEGILSHLRAVLPAPAPYLVPDKPFGGDSMGYLDEVRLAEWENLEKAGWSPLEIEEHFKAKGE
jgi:hypothetical protein